jgi:hypothetical protein
MRNMTAVPTLPHHVIALPGGDGHASAVLIECSGDSHLMLVAMLEPTDPGAADLCAQVAANEDHLGLVMPFRRV